MNPKKGRALYDEGHIPGAYFLRLDEDLSAPKTGKNGRHPLPDVNEFAKRINECGVTPDSRVVVYDDVGGNFAVRLWWMLRWLGHEKTALLDGGIPQWKKEGRPLSTDVPPPRKGSFVPRPHLGDTVDVHFIERFHEDPFIALIDARTAERFAGLTEPIDPVAGHIPGAVNRFWKENLNADGLFKPPGQLRAEFKKLLGEHPERAIHMCGSGVTACHNAFAMELAGLPAGRLYAVRHVKHDRLAEGAHDCKRTEINDEVIVSERRSSLSQKNVAVACGPRFFQNLPHFLRRQELTLL
jgi:thiosulfate/3-mercaptopyruvate sulfurtransferase